MTVKCESQCLEYARNVPSVLYSYMSALSNVMNTILCSTECRKNVQSYLLIPMQNDMVKLAESSEVNMN